MSRARAAAAALLAGLLGAGCLTTSLPREELPEQPIAFVYRTRDEAEQLALVRERMRRAMERTSPLEDRNVLDLNQLGEAVGLGPDAEDRAAAMLGRVALYHPRRGEVELLDFAPRGTRPLAWSPDHRRLLYLMSQRGVAQVYEYDLDSKDVRPVTTAGRRHLSGAIGPGGLVVFSELTPIERGGGGIRLFLRDPESGRAAPITAGPADSKPVIAPDASYVIFEQRDAEARGRIARVDLPADDAEPRVIAMGEDPSLTPDGEWVVYAAPVRGSRKLWRMRPDGSGKQRIGPGLVDEEELDPSVSPDGAYVVFVSEDFDLKRLMLRPLRGGPTWPLITDGEGLEPVW